MQYKFEAGPEINVFFTSEVGNLATVCSNYRHATGAYNGVNEGRNTPVLPHGAAVALGTGTVDPVDKPVDTVF